jgi:putative Mg2+ transporter-C (MgtC) family protein
MRLGLALLLGGLVGYERETRAQPAGLRTHILVAVGSCLFTLVSAYGFADFTHAAGVGDAIRADVTRIASQVVVGIGFLGGGTILRHGTNIKGLTTAASLWVTAAIGLAVGSGLYVTATVATLIAILSLRVFKTVERRVPRRGGDTPPETSSGIEPD